jgi:murein DD-endopeptidase MepM/ murein hydrolase activator NlpD
MMRTPIDKIRITPHGAYGYYRADKRRHHYGVDLGGPAGTPVYAPERMAVVVRRRGSAIETSPRFRGIGLDGYGPGAVLAVGASGVVHVLGHLGLDGMPPIGAEVAEGDRIGSIGSPRHVHWEARLGDRAPWPRSTRGDDTVDPMGLVRGGGGGGGGGSQIAEKVKAETKKSAIAEVLVVGALMLLKKR